MRTLWIRLSITVGLSMPAFGGAAWAGATMAFVGPKSIYAKAGLRTGDEVVNIDGKVPATASEVGQRIHLLAGDGQTHHIVVLRNGGNVELTFK